MSAGQLLLDTHAFVWYATDTRRIRPGVLRLIGDAAAAFVSAASVWEIRTKFRLGKMPSVAAIAADLPHVITELGLQPLAIDVHDGARAGAFAAPHRDPFDRMLAAQAINRGLTLVSNDAAVDAFGVVRVW